MNQLQLVFGLETYRSKLVSPKDWNPRLRMSPSSRLFFSFFSFLTVVFFSFFFFCTRNSKKKTKKTTTTKKTRTTTRRRRNPSHGRWQCQGLATTTRYDNHLDSFFLAFNSLEFLGQNSKSLPSLIVFSNPNVFYLFSFFHRVLACLTKLYRQVSFLTILGKQGRLQLNG